MKASEIKRFERMGKTTVPDWCYRGRPAEVDCFLNERTEVAYQLWEEAGKYRHTDPLQGHAKPYSDWKQLTTE